MGEKGRTKGSCRCHRRTVPKRTTNSFSFRWDSEIYGLYDPVFVAGYAKTGRTGKPVDGTWHPIRRCRIEELKKPDEDGYRIQYKKFSIHSITLDPDFWQGHGYVKGVAVTAAGLTLNLPGQYIFGPVRSWAVEEYETAIEDYIPLCEDLAVEPVTCI